MGLSNTYCRLSLALTSLTMVLFVFALVGVCFLSLAIAEVADAPLQPCSVPGSQRLSRELQVHSTCEGDGGEVSTIPLSSCVQVSSQASTCALPLVALRYGERWFFADSMILENAIECDRQCQVNREKRADELAMACLRGELTACRTLREEERRAAAARLDAIKIARLATGDAGPSSDENAATILEVSADGGADVIVNNRELSSVVEGDDENDRDGGTEDAVQVIEVVTKMSCALRAEPELYGATRIRLTKGRRCQRVNEEEPYFQVICGDDRGWAIESCFHNIR